MRGGIYDLNWSPLPCGDQDALTSLLGISHDVHLCCSNLDYKVSYGTPNKEHALVSETSEGLCGFVCVFVSVGSERIREILFNSGTILILVEIKPQKES